MASDEHDNNNSFLPAGKKRSGKISVLNEEFDLSLFILISKKKWKLLTSIAVIAIISATLYIRYAQRIYQESCIMQVGSQNTANKVLNPTNNIYQTGENDMAEAVELMRSRIFLEKTLRILPLEISYYTEGTFKNAERYLTSPYSVDIDTTARAKLKRVPIYISFNSINQGKLTCTMGRGVKTTFTFYTGQWCVTPYGKIKVNVVIPSEISKSILNLEKDADFFEINDYNYLSKEYAQKITVKILDADAKTISISCSDADDTKASDIVNTAAAQYIKEILDKRSKSDENILSFVNDQLDTIYTRIRETEKRIGDTTNIQANSSNLLLPNANDTYLSSLDSKLEDIEFEQKQLQDVSNKIHDKQNIDPLDFVMQLSIMSDAGDGSSNELKESIEALRGLVNQRQTVSFDATDANNKMQELDSLIKRQKLIIFKSIDLLGQKLELVKKEYIAQKEGVQNKSVSPAEKGSLEKLRLQRQIAIDQKWYDLFLEKKAEYAISKAGFVPESEILENAIPSWVPVYPKKVLILSIAILIAAAIGIIILVIVYLFYNNITSVYEIEKLTESPITILGIIPKYTKEIPHSQIIVNHNPKSMLAESFRSIRTNLQFISNETTAKIIAITSTISGEGKTFICVNLGGIIAYSGKKVIILDLDMRRPRIHNAFGLDNSKGMSTLLIGKYKMEDVIQKTENENLDIIPAGPIPPNPSELVISKAMDDVLEKLKSIYDIIIIDNPPVGLVTDGIAMLQKADYPIYIMRVDYSKREFIYFVDKLYYENKFHKLSIILNSVDFNRHKYGYSYYKYGYYGYGHTYGHGNYYET